MVTSDNAWYRQLGLPAYRVSGINLLSMTKNRVALTGIVFFAICWLGAFTTDKSIKESRQVGTEQRDESFPTVHFVTVDSNVKLEVLDWGGSGRALVLLAGLGSTAHTFDHFAPKLTRTYHVYGSPGGDLAHRVFPSPVIQPIDWVTTYWKSSTF